MNKLRFFPLLATVFVFVFMVSFQALADKSEEEMLLKRRQCGQGNFRFQIAALSDNVPFSWTSKGRNENRDEVDFMHGLDYEFVMKLIEGSPIKRIRIIPVSTQEELQDLILNNKADIALGASYINHQDLSKSFLYPSYLGNPIVAVFAKGKGRVITDTEQLRGLKIVSLAGENLKELLKYTMPKEASLSVVADTKTLFQDLLSGKADVALIGLYTATADADKYKIKEDLYFSQTPLRYPRFFVLMTQGRNCSVFIDEFREKAKKLSKDTAFMGEILAKTYDNLSTLNKDVPKLEIPVFTPVKEEANPAPAEEKDIPISEIF